MKSEKAVEIAIQLAETALASSKSSLGAMAARDVADFIETLSTRLMALDYKEEQEQRVAY